MSRIGKKPVLIPSDVTITHSGDEIIVKGPKGELALRIPSGVSVAQEKTEEGTDVLNVSFEGDASALWGTTRAHLNNMVIGVTQGWSKSLELNGVGFRMEVKGNTLVMRLGFSHEVEFALPEGIVASIENNVVTIAGIDRQQVGQIASEIRALKKPEPYKGKGFRYTDEVVRRKAGKAAKSE